MEAWENDPVVSQSGSSSSPWMNDPVVQSPKLPDMSGVNSTVTKNLQVPKPEDGEAEKEPEQQTFSAKLDQGMGMPITQIFGNNRGNILLPPEMRGHLVDAYKNNTSADASDFFQNAVPSAASTISPLGRKWKDKYDEIVNAAHEGVKEGAEFKPFGDSMMGGLLNAPFQVAAALPSIAANVAETAGYKGAGADVEAGLMATGMLGLPHPELQEVVGEKIGKPASAVTHNDIAQAIRMGFEDKGIPKAQDFKDTATVMLGHENESLGESTLHDVYQKTGVTPDAVHSDALIEPKIISDIKEGKIPSAYQELIEKPKEEETQDEEPAKPIPKNERRDLSPEHQEIEEKLGVPETMNASQLGKLDTKIQGIFSDIKQTSAFSYEQFTALEDYARRIESAQDAIERKKTSEKISDPNETSVKKFPPASAMLKNPVLSFIKNRGGIERGSKLDQEIKSMGNISPRFYAKKGMGLGDVDNFPLREWQTHLDEGKDNAGYVDRQYVLDAIREELHGNPVTGRKQAIMDEFAHDPDYADHLAENASQDEFERINSEILEYQESEEQKYQEIRQERLAISGEQEKHIQIRNLEDIEHELEQEKAAAELGQGKAGHERSAGIAGGEASGAEREEQRGSASQPTGSQREIAGTERSGQQLAAAHSDRRLKSGVTQKEADEGLFDVAGRSQGDIFDQIKTLVSDEAGSAQIPQSAKDFGNELKRDILNFATPMETGSPRAQAAAKDFANKQRFAQWNGARITNLLHEKFSPEELKNMWNALDESSVHAQTLESNGMSREEAMAQTERDNIGHFALPEEQKEIIKAMSDWAQHSWDQAKKLGMVEGDGLPFWTPRMAVAIGEDGKWNAPSGERPSVDVGKNLRTTSGNLKERKYLTSQETEAAMKKAFGGEKGDEAMLVRDIRTMPLALARLEQAIGGRSLINEIKEMGKNTGAETVSGGGKEGYFTLDHPAFQTYRPRLKMNDEGKWEVQKDADGNDIFDKHPIYISKEFEGPLKAVLSRNSSTAYKALMQLKGKTMGLIMYSPLIHNAVEWGRALPTMPGKVITGKIYFEGNRIKNDPMQMKEAIDAGMVPIGSRYFNQDISSIIEQPNLTPGRSWTAKLLGGLVGEVNKKGGEGVKSAIDKAGDIWHNTLLWDRVGDLQAGIYGNIRDKNIENGMEPQAAQAMAAHIANRFAGALPMESMGNLATKMANVTMFSRSFTIGNLGVMKDMFKGLPSDVMAQLQRDVGETTAEQASKATQRKAIAAFALDIGLMYAGNSILQDTIDHLKRDKSLDQIEKGYVDRFDRLMKKHQESPWELLNLPADLQSLSSTSSNEPGKENRIHFSTDPKTGTAYYMRLPTGKMGEEFEGWATSPLEMMNKKESTTVKPLQDIYNNADHFGHPIYDKDARGISGAAANIGKVVTHLMEAQIPEDSIKSAYNLLSGQSKNKPLDYMKSLGPLGGFTFSKGYPGGPEAGILAAASKRHESEVSAALPQIKDAVESDDEDKARDIMEKLDMSPREQKSLINHYRNPQGKVNARSMGKFERIATPEEKELMGEQQ